MPIDCYERKNIAGILNKISFLFDPMLQILQIIHLTLKVFIKIVFSLFILQNKNYYRYVKR